MRKGFRSKSGRGIFSLLLLGANHFYWRGREGAKKGGCGRGTSKKRAAAAAPDGRKEREAIKTHLKVLYFGGGRREGVSSVA